MVRCVCMCARAIVGAMERATHLEAFRIGMRGGAVGVFFNEQMVGPGVQNAAEGLVIANFGDGVKMRFVSNS